MNLFHIKSAAFLYACILCAFFGFCLAPFAAIYAQTRLGADAKGFYPEGEYRVTATIRVKPGDTLVFAAGSIIRFDTFTGLAVHGTLIAKGTRLKPILFTAARDLGPRTIASATPAPFDWNGIAAESPTCRINMAYCSVRYSVFGLDIRHETSQVSLEKVSFVDNGSASCNRTGAIVVFLEDTLPHSHTWPVADLKPTQVLNTMPETTTKSTPKQPKNSPNITPVQEPSSWKTPVRIIGGTFVVAGGAIALVGKFQTDAAYQRYLTATDSVQVRLEKAAITEKEGISFVGIILMLAGAMGFSLTFLF